MDNRRLNTGDILGIGILNLPNPVSGCPDDAVLTCINEDDLTADTLRKGLESGGLEASMYYGCWSIWKTDTGFSGELMQYRSITDSFSNKNIDDAVEKAMEWGAAC